MKHKPGFTLIEILVVISIIGFIATAGMIYLQQVREDGRIAALLQFSNGIKSNLASSHVSYWSFDNKDATDSWGKNSGIVNGANCSKSGVLRNACYFNGTNYIRVATSTSLTNNFISTNDWTFEAWIKPDLQGDDYQDIFEGIYHRPRIAIINSERSLLLAGYAPNYRNLAEKTEIINNKWQHIIVIAKIVDNNFANYKLYHNGKKVFDNNARRITGVLNSDYYFIGGRTGEYFKGLIDEVKIYSEALNLAQIQKNYTEGALRHEFAVK